MSLNVVGKATRFRQNALYWLLVSFLALVFITGGSARSDVPGLLVLRSVAIVLFVYSLSRLSREQLRENWGVLSFASGIAILVLVQMIPLPPQLWHQIPGRQIIQDVDQVFSLGPIWRPISMTPFETQNAFFSLFVPGAALAIGLHLTQRQLENLVIVLLILGGMSVLLGLMQIESSRDSALYLFSIANVGSPIGFFANRNHQAFLIAALIPMLFYWATRRNAGAQTKIIASLCGFLILIFLLVLGSRMGLVLFATAVLMLPFLAYQRGSTTSQIGTRLAQWNLFRLTLITSGALLFTLAVNLNRALAWDRLNLLTPDDDARIKILPTLFEMISNYWPLGSGWGSFERIYQVHEPDELLSPAYMNHAHNDWLEVLLGGGLPAASILGVAIVAVLYRAWKAFGMRNRDSEAILLARVGHVVILMAGIASLTDYPLRTPIGAVVFVIALLWVCRAPPKRLMLQTNF